MTKSELIERLSQEQPHLPPRDVEFSVNAVLDHMRRALVAGDRIEIRGFGSIGLRYRRPRTGRNPKTGESVSVPGKYVPHFKPGRQLRERVNQEKGSQFMDDEPSSDVE
ncbi:MAG TPA: integration host factor subunit beta [Gammaproteobacteria bacterium]|nr:integration host factor subunit beta [Gammaproteobacteria bacterium]